MLSEPNVSQAADVQVGGAKRVAFTITEEVDRDIEIGAAQRGITKSQLVIEAVAAYLRNSEAS